MRAASDAHTELEPRQAMLPFFQSVPTFVDLFFTGKYQPHLVDASPNESDTMRVNVCVLLSMTSYFDASIRAEKREIEMPFGSAALMKRVIQWIVYGEIEDDFALLQECVEFCRFYGIKVPQNDEDIDESIGIIQHKTDDDDDIPYLNQIPSQDDSDLPVLPEKTVQFAGKYYVRKWRNRKKTGWYYKCLAKQCKGSLFVGPEGMREVHPHDPDLCTTTGSELTFPLPQWEEIDQLMRRCVISTKSKLPFDILTQFLQADPELSRDLLSAPLSAILRYISLMLKEKASDAPLRESLSQFSLVDEGGILYQQVMPRKMIIYSFSAFRSLAKSVTWLLIDGTFRSCPKGFAQCVTLLSRDEETGVFFPLCHSLLPDKSAETYHLLFNILNTHFSFPSLSWITVDFEEALVKSLRVWISTKPWKIRLIGCKFHFGKAIGKRFRGKRHKLSTVDSEFLSLFLRTPFMDRKSIDRVFHGLSTVQHPYDSFLRYFKKNWLKDERFALWNLSEATDSGLISRYTNNGIESFHKGMNRSMCPHPNIGTFLRWAQRCGEERFKQIQSTPKREFALDSDKLVDQLDSRFLWEQLIQSFPIKPAYNAIFLSFTCPECMRRNCLAGRRTSHLHCENQDCRFSAELLPYSYVLHEVQCSLACQFNALCLSRSAPLSPACRKKM